MKIKLILVALSLSFLSCKSYVQVYETKADNIKTIENAYVFENDSLTITYNFWQEKGLMEFVIYNKLEVPLYIDWRKSSYVDNSVKLNYWEDVETTNALFRSYYSTSFYGMRNSSGRSTATKSKQERITFIPPKAIYSRAQYYLLPRTDLILDKTDSFKEVPLYDTSKKNTKVYTKAFTKEESPLIFRNFLTFSLTEAFNSEFYVDNQFHISKILKMEDKHFYGKDGKLVRTRNKNLPFQDDRYFFINLAHQKKTFKVRRVHIK
ncbi:hypothetical protein [Ulvibacter litoralis]|uniref:DUF3108 domain-containing protein n=1 Tax=Ulvibacter litoralis TaxID=227084 RepID=A0A1G7CA44_9FLAO|nr:hypothetical protein [Ulvibacter litoralis]GHC48075.1 hypothetical protein GCM10008083_09220 [Ulvibacter litoralis]SDE36187.1 hypothetical protein SAMN05421855_101269 [Ulvibacter litoralis]